MEQEQEGCEFISQDDPKSIADLNETSSRPEIGIDQPEEKTFLRRTVAS